MLLLLPAISLRDGYSSFSSADMLFERCFLFRWHYSSKYCFSKNKHINQYENEQRLNYHFLYLHKIITNDRNFKNVRDLKNVHDFKKCSWI
jgi:hypothetical protein